MEDTPTRVIAIVLPETEWHALLLLEHEPVGWLRRKIRERLERADSLAAIPSSYPDRPIVMS